MVQSIVENILPEYRKKKPEFVAMVNADILKNVLCYSSQEKGELWQ